MHVQGKGYPICNKSENSIVLVGFYFKGNIHFGDSEL